MEKYFPRSTTAAVRAVSAIVIVFCHLGRVMAIRADNPLLMFGEYSGAALGIFFFYTGYNIIAAYLSKGERWKKGFWRKKLLGIYFPFVICNLLFQCFFWLLKLGPYDAPRIVYFALGGYLINPDAWYIQSCMLAYLLVYVLLAAADILLRGKKLPAPALVLLCAAVLTAYNLIYTARGTYISSESVLPLPLFAGMAAASLGDGFLAAWKKHKWSSALILFFLTGYTEYIRLLGVSSPVILGAELYDVLSMVFKVLLINSLVIGEELSSRFLNTLSRYSLYMYLTHSLCYRFLRSELVYIENDALYVLVYLICVCVLSYLLGRLTEYVLGVGKPAGETV